MDRDLSGGQRYPPFEQLGPLVLESCGSSRGRGINPLQPPRRSSLPLGDSVEVLGVLFPVLCASLPGEDGIFQKKGT